MLFFQRKKSQAGFLDILSAITLAILLVGVATTSYLTHQSQEIRKFAMEIEDGGGGGGENNDFTFSSNVNPTPGEEENNDSTTENQHSYHPPSSNEHQYTDDELREQETERQIQAKDQAAQEAQARAEEERNRRTEDYGTRHPRSPDEWQYTDDELREQETERQIQAKDQAAQETQAKKDSPGIFWPSTGIEPADFNAFTVPTINYPVFSDNTPVSNSSPRIFWPSTGIEPADFNAFTVPECTTPECIQSALAFTAITAGVTTGAVAYAAAPAVMPFVINNTPTINLIGAGILSQIVSDPTTSMDVTAFMTGKDPLTGASLSPIEMGIVAAGIVLPGLGGIPITRKLPPATNLSPATNDILTFHLTEKIISLGGENSNTNLVRFATDPTGRKLTIDTGEQVILLDLNSESLQHLIEEGRKAFSSRENLYEFTQRLFRVSFENETKYWQTMEQAKKTNTPVPIEQLIGKKIGGLCLERSCYQALVASFPDDKRTYDLWVHFFLTPQEKEAIGHATYTLGYDPASLLKSLATFQEMGFFTSVNTIQSVRFFSP